MFCEEENSSQRIPLKQFRVAIRSLGFEPVREEVQALIDKAADKMIDSATFLQYMSGKY